ncbi:MAG: LuxR C-terminal-related transcriptional regulator, partial [Caulobacterales bacterium]
MNLSGYVAQVTACEDAQALKRVLLRGFEDYGAKAISGFTFPFGGAVSSGERTPIITTFPKPVSEIYRAILIGDDPVMYAAMTLGAPVHFLKIENKLRLTDSAKQVFQVMRECGLQDGVSTPVFAKPGVYAYFTVAFAEPRLDLTEADLRTIKIMFEEYFYRFRDITRVRKGVLSQREREVLVAIVNDKSNAEIGESLGISEHTVETYVRRCFAKLDVN